MQEQEMNHDPAEDKRLYVIVRADIPIGYQMAQACHAAAAIGADQPKLLKKYPTIVILNACCRHHLQFLYDEAAFNRPVEFREPDLGDEMTAFAVFSSGEEFRHLDLAGGGAKPEGVA